MPTGIIYETDMDILDDDGCVIRRVRISPHIAEELERIFHKRLRIDVETGLPSDLDIDDEALIMIRYSDDNGKTWSNERQLGVGEVGEYHKIIETWRLGKGRNRIYEISMSDPYPWAISDAFVEVEGSTG